jgi:hypothetical protein
VIVATHFQPHRRVNLALLFEAVRPSSTRRFSKFLGPTAGAVVVRYNDTRGGRPARDALSGGADVALSLTPHLAIVPGVRFHTELEYLALARPKVAIRWTF